MLESITSKFGFETPEQKRNTGLLGVGGMILTQAGIGAVMGVAAKVLLASAVTVGLGAAILSNPVTATIAGLAIVAFPVSVIANLALSVYVKTQHNQIF